MANNTELPLASTLAERAKQAKEELIQKLMQTAQKPQVDLSALMALSDSEFGGNLSQSYKRPMTQEQALMAASELSPEGADGGMTAYQREQMRIADERNKLLAARQSASGQLTPYQQASLKLQNKKLDQMSKAEERRMKNATFKIEQADELSSKEVENLTGLESTMQRLNEIVALKKGVNTGPAAEQVQNLKRLVTSKDSNFVDLEQVSGLNLFDYIKAQSGAAYSEKELEALKRNMPNVGDNDTEFDRKLSNIQGIIAKKRTTMLSNLKKYQNKKVGAANEILDAPKDSTPDFDNMTDEELNAYLGG